ncbi:MAG: FAD-dependent oxidoreductase [Candidatus Rokubacteria bacterium]|nr:FAD-dependent oxidoreductase [Candidatus Rokubacteria bacterium]
MQSPRFEAGDAPERSVLALRHERSSMTVAVVGGGVIGVASAYYLARAGARVTLLERAHVAAAASYGNSGLIVPSHSVPLARPGALAQGLRWMLDAESPFYVRPRADPALARWLWRFRVACTEAHVRRAIPVLRALSEASLGLFRELAGEIDFGFRTDGVLMVYRTPRGLDEGRHEAAVLEGAGIAAKIMDAAGARTIEPTLRSDIAGAVLFPADAHVTPDRFVRGLAARAASLGAEIREGTEVLDVLTAGDRITGLDTTRGEVPCEQLVLAAGPWSPAIARKLDLDLPIQAAKGYSVTYVQPPAGPRVPMLLGEARVAVTPMRGERGEMLRLGGTLELAGLDLSIDRRRVEAIKRGARAFLDLPTDMALLEVWRGLRPCTPDGLPALGRPRRWRNVVVAAGHAMLGLSLGPITGHLVAQLVAGQTPPVDVTALDPDRFRGRWSAGRP